MKSLNQPQQKKEYNFTQLIKRLNQSNLTGVQAFRRSGVQI